LSFEIYEQLEDIPDYVSVPTAYGDGLYGIWKGFKDLKNIEVSNKLPTMCASEVFGSLKETLNKNQKYPEVVPSGVSRSFSIASGVGTYQALYTLKDSEGLAETSEDEETMRMQNLLASTEGIYGEAASLTSLVAIEKLKQQNKINENSKIVSILTSTGLKDTASTAVRLPDVRVIEPHID